MKIIKWITSITLLILIGMITAYADVNISKENEYNELVEAFESTDANFKFYNIKANSIINYDITKDELRYLCMEIISNLGLEENDIKWDETDSNGQSQVFAQVKDNDKNISIACTKKNSEEAYIIVDIFDNKVYKNIVDIYTILENTINEKASQLDMYICVAGEFNKKLQINKYDDIFNNILYNMNAEQIDKVQEENFVSVTAYSKILSGSYLEYLGNKINLNIGMRYSENEEKTLIYVATPIIKLDY
ncbi:hypothetical protein CHL78_017665 [Romboutsia weinsteinii]|uniref:TATA-box binding protein n=1 Tax=Romboutsia weinsteinii TaxID=2020949 RepID=A0A371IYJ0_9FIRM|nr:YwmB family TATA-box binding protein [Romboutsia weinsteinii]RDY25547.1 hypothetical protein CHL78_017665 [Romboutsia weinsteinii]